MWYVETSVIVSALVPEDNSASATAWFDRQQPDSLAISQWVEIECHAALSRKVRTNRLSEQDRDYALTELATRLLPNLKMLWIEANHYPVAISLVDHFNVGIRAGDALHLAIAGANGMTLATLDKALARGAKALGHNVELIA